MTAGTGRALRAVPWLLVPTQELPPALPSACCAYNVSQERLCSFLLACHFHPHEHPKNAPALPALPGCLSVPAVPWLERAWLGLNVLGQVLGAHKVWWAGQACGEAVEVSWSRRFSSPEAVLLAAGCRRPGLLPEHG